MRNLMDILADLKKINEQIAEAPDSTQSDEAALENLKIQRLRLEKELDKVRTSCLKHSKTSKR